MTEKKSLKSTAESGVLRKHCRTKFEMETVSHGTESSVIAKICRRNRHESESVSKMSEKL